MREARYVLTPEEWLAEDALALNRDIVLHRKVETVAPLEESVSALADWRWSVEVDLGQNSWIDAEVPLSDAYGVVASQISTVGLNGRLDGVVNLENQGEGTVLQGEVGIDKGRQRSLKVILRSKKASSFSQALPSQARSWTFAPWTPLGNTERFGWTSGGRPAQMRLAFPVRRAGPTPTWRPFFSSIVRPAA